MFNSDMTKHLAELSKISFTDSELEQMTADMTDIINLMDKVCEFDNPKNDYTIEAVDYNNLRNDEYKPSLSVDEITSNAKKVKNNSFAVPKVV